MEFKFRAVDDRPSPTTMISCITEQALRGLYWVEVIFVCFLRKICDDGTEQNFDPVWYVLLVLKNENRVSRSQVINCIGIDCHILHLP